VNPSPDRARDPRARLRPTLSTRASRLETLIDLLGDPSPTVWRSVRGELQKLGRAAGPSLRRAARGDDPRARTRARQFLLQRDRERVSRRLTGYAMRPELDLERGLLLLARIEEPGLDARPYSTALDAMAAEVVRRTESRPPGAKRARALVEYLGRELGYTGDEGDYHHPDNVYLHRAIVRRRGLPLTLVAIYLFVARRAGIPAAPVALPGHVVLRLHGPDRNLLIDPFNGGAELSERECLCYLAARGLARQLPPPWPEARGRADLARLAGSPREHSGADHGGRSMSHADEIPAGWPPADEPTNSVLAPLFPLPNLFLFPGTVMPLHIFEPRYRQMIEDSLDGPGRIVIGTILADHHDEISGNPPVHDIAGLGEIARHERLPDGRFVIMLVGLARVRIREVDSDRLYRRVEASPLLEIAVEDGDEERLRDELIEAVLARTPDLREHAEKLPDDMPIGHLTDLLLLRMQLPQNAMQMLYSQLVVADRARSALQEHARRPLPPEGTEPDEGEPGTGRFA